MSNVVLLPSSWILEDTEDNALASVTRAAPAGGISHRITSVSGCFDATGVTGKALILKDDTTEIARWIVEEFVTFHAEFPYPIQITPGNAVTLELEASGSGGVSGTCVLNGITL